MSSAIRLIPKAALDDVLAFRDPDPTKAVLPHPAYRSNDSDAVAEGVKVQSVGVALYRREQIKSLAAQERARPPGDRRLNLADQEIDEAINKIEVAVRQEIERTIWRKRQACPVHYVKRIGPRNALEHESALVGQYGLFIRHEDVSAKRPTLTNGRIVGIFAGAPLKTEAERTSHVKALSNGKDFDHYSVNIAASLVAQAVTVSPMNGGNSMALANTAILAGTTGTMRPVYDDSRINAVFIACDVMMIDKKGNFRAEQVAAVVGLENLKDQLYLNYGDNYLSHFVHRPEPTRSSSRLAEALRDTISRKRGRGQDEDADRWATDRSLKRLRTRGRSR